MTEGTKQVCKEIYEEYCIISNIVTRLASEFPDDPKVWEGSISDRLIYLLKKKNDFSVDLY